MFRHLWHHWLYGLTLTCAGVLIGSLALMSSPAQAQGRARQANTPLSQARQALQADFGFDNRFALRTEVRSPNRFPAPATGSQTGTLKSAPGSSCWSLVSSPNPSADYNQLYGTSALSPKDIWAVGHYNNPDDVAQTLIEHWNGSSWSVVPSPNVGDDVDNYLSGVGAVTPDDVWAVGYYYDATANHNHTLTEHWDGSAWSVMSSPNPGGSNNILESVAATSRKDVWAVGAYRIVDGPQATLTEHWDGTSWTVVSSPSPGTNISNLFAVTAAGPNNFWAVGFDCDLDGCPPGRTLTEHWNGSNWSIVSSPNGGPEGNRLLAVSASSPNDVWAVGFYCTACGIGDEVDYGLIEHWDGNSWRMVPHTIAASAEYFGVIAINPNDAWAVGSATNDGGNTYTNVVSHWDGASWSDVQVGSPGAYDNDLRSLAAIGRNDVWAVGDYDNGNGEQTQVQHFAGPCK